MTALHRSSLTALARLTVVVPVGPGDRVSPVLLAQLTELPRDAELYLVFVNAADTTQLQTLPKPESGPQPRPLIAVVGRAVQQNIGAAAGIREWLWFLHADSQLASTTLAALAKFVQNDEVALGYFDLRFLDDGPALMRLNALGADLRSRWLGLPFGDQGLVLPRRVFERLGRFNPLLTSGEDHELVWRARRAKVPLRAVGAPLYTSARTYADGGWMTTTVRRLQETWRQARRFARGDIRDRP